MRKKEYVTWSKAITNNYTDCRVAYYSMKGLLISFDGVDASGKATQVRELKKYFEGIGHKVHQFETPDYTTPPGKELKRRLQNKDGKWNSISWEEKMRLFATNRKEHREEVIKALQAGDIVIYDRYVPSSMAFIAIESGLEEDAYKAVQQEEYETNGMPKEAISIFLDVPPNFSQKLLTGRKEEIQEDDEYTDDISVQERLYDEYTKMSDMESDRYIRIQCIENDGIRTIEDIAKEVQKKINEQFPSIQQAK